MSFRKILIAKTYRRYALKTTNQDGVLRKINAKNAKRLTIMKYFASSNLITNLKFKQQVGVKADAHIEALANINKNEVENDENVDLKIPTGKPR